MYQAVYRMPVHRAGKSSRAGETTQPNRHPTQNTDTEKQKYEQLKGRMSAHEELFGLLKTIPEREALHVLQRIRAGGKIKDIVAHIRDGNLLLQLSLIPEM